MHILLLEEDSVISEKLAFVLDSKFNAKVTQASGVDEARKWLRELKAEIHLVVVDVDKAKAQEAEKLRKEFPEHPCIVFLQGSQNKPQAVSAPPGRPAPVFVDRTDIVQNLVAAVNSLIEKSLVPHASDDRNYCKIRTKLLLAVCPLKSDIFIRLSDSKYVKLFREGDAFDARDMEKYTVQKGVDHLFIPRDSTEEFIRKYQADLTNFLEKKPEIDLNEAVMISDQAFDTVQELSKAIGFTPEVQKISKTHVALTLKSMGKSPKLSQVLAQLDAFEGKYIASHSNLCAYLSCSIASQLKWGSDTTFYKLTLASFLHDIALENHELAKCNTLKEVNEGKFSEEDKKTYKNHPVKGAEIATRFSEVPPDVDVIIAQHHERADGTGFPRGLAPNYIAPLAAIFIVAHDLTQFAIEKGKGFKVEEFIELTRDQYRPSQFRKIIQGLQQIDHF